MAAFSEYYEVDESQPMNYLLLTDYFNDAIEEAYSGNNIYWDLVIKNYNGKRIEIKITDIEKDKWYQERIKDKK